ncbi:MAG: hypothetical protein JW761_12215, partial [Prolixibacteraceae bacterium]|nr:hypothetical protein [Prolixibacteraceae bacterium]
MYQRELIGQSRIAATARLNACCETQQKHPVRKTPVIAKKKKLNHSSLRFRMVSSGFSEAKTK